MQAKHLVRYFTVFGLVRHMTTSLLGPLRICAVSEICRTAFSHTVSHVVHMLRRNHGRWARIKSRSWSRVNHSFATLSVVEVIQCYCWQKHARPTLSSPNKVTSMNYARGYNLAGIPLSSVYELVLTLSATNRYQLLVLPVTFLHLCFGPCTPSSVVLFHRAWGRTAPEKVHEFTTSNIIF